MRTALTRDAWTAINRAWLMFDNRAAPAAPTATLNLVEAVKAETRGFEGAIHWMMRNQATWFIRLGAAIERADNTARLLDVKYHLLLPEGEQVGGVVDRDQWTTILQTVSAVTAYRWLYSDGLKPAHVIDLLIARFELPRSLAGCAEEVVEVLTLLGKRTGLQGEADRMARRAAGGDAAHAIARRDRQRAAPISDRLHPRERPAPRRDRQAVQVRMMRLVDRPPHPLSLREPQARLVQMLRLTPRGHRTTRRWRLAYRRRLRRAAAAGARRLRQQR